MANYRPSLAIEEVRTRLAEKDIPALPEMSITAEKHEVLVTAAHGFLTERHIEKCPVRFDVVGLITCRAAYRSCGYTELRFAPKVLVTNENAVQTRIMGARFAQPGMIRFSAQ